MYKNLDINTITQLNKVFNSELNNKVYAIKSNVALAAAVTAYARIVMSRFKNNPNFDLFYTDTDSIFIDTALPNEMVGKELGLMKDELDGGFILKAWFFGIKKYAYLDNNNNLTTVFSGLPKNSLTLEEVEDLANRKVVTKQIPDQFFKSLLQMQIAIKKKTVKVVFNPDKKLVGNKYHHIHIRDLKSNITKILARKFVSSVKSLVNKFKL